MSQNGTVVVVQVEPNKWLVKHVDFDSLDGCRIEGDYEHFNRKAVFNLLAANKWTPEPEEFGSLDAAWERMWQIYDEFEERGGLIEYGPTDISLEDLK